jgi:CubicO group peptidase (beta-lactamase class C family)
MRHVTRCLFLALSILGAMIPGFAQLPNLDAYLKGLAQEGTFYGSVQVVKGDTTVFRGDYGFRDEAQTQPNGPSSVYYASFLCEPILATLAMKAQELGLLSLDAPIGTYLPAFKNKPSPRVRDLLCHASGLPVYKPNMLLNAQPGSLTLAALASGIAERPLLETPGTRFVWMFNNYDLAGLILETVTGKPYPILLSEWLLQPLGMSRTGVGVPPKTQTIAWGTRLAAFQKDLTLWQGGYRCSMGLYSTVEDLGLFLQALATGRIVSAQSYQAMKATHVKDGTEGVGIGFFVDPSGVLHNGGHDASGYQALFWFDPRYDLRVLILGNRWMDAEGRSVRSLMVLEVYAALGLSE